MGGPGTRVLWIRFEVGRYSRRKVPRLQDGSKARGGQWAGTHPLGVALCATAGVLLPKGVSRGAAAAGVGGPQWGLGLGGRGSCCGGSVSVIAVQPCLQPHRPISRSGVRGKEEAPPPSAPPLVSW